MEAEVYIGDISCNDRVFNKDFVKDIYEKNAKFYRSSCTLKLRVALTLKFVNIEKDINLKKERVILKTIIVYFVIIKYSI